MLYRTHLTTSTAIAIPTLALCNELSVITIAGVALGSLLPDIDTPKSFIGSRLKVISYPINKCLGHRGIIHSLIPIVAIIGIGFILKSVFMYAIAFGFFLHLIEDTFSESGVKWFAPFSEKSIRMPFEFLRYSTGGLKEHLILGVAILILYLELKNGKYITEGVNELSGIISSSIDMVIHNFI